MKNKTESIPKNITITDLAELCGVTERWVNALTKAGTIPRPGPEGFPTRSTVAALFRRKDNSDIQQEKFLKLAAERRQSERRDRVAQKLEEKSYITTEEVSSILEIGIKSIELVPGKMESEFGLTPEQTRRLQQLLDEARSSWAKQIEEMPD